MKLEELYFGIVRPAFGYGRDEERNRLEPANLFASGRVRRSVAMWVTMDDKEKKKHEFLSWCFGDTRWRTEYEFIVCPWPYREDDTIDGCGQKVDTYTLYVQPNEKLLRQMVDSVTKSSAQKYLKEERMKWKKKS